MEQTSLSLRRSNRKRTKPGESAPSCSAKKSQKGKQYGQWQLLPDEMVVSIFKLLPNKDLLACRAVCKRFAKVIGESVLLDKAFCRQFAQPPDPALFGKDRYKQVLRPWFETLVAAQTSSLTDVVMDIWFTSAVASMERKGRGTSGSGRTEQVQAIKPSQVKQVKQLDCLIEHSEFPKALFFIQAKTLQNAESLCFQEKISYNCYEIAEKACFSPDGRNLLISFSDRIRFMVLDGNGDVIRKYDKWYDSTVCGLRFSPNGRSLLIYFFDRIAIMGLDGEDWVQKGEASCGGWEESAFFSPDSDGLATVFDDSVRITGRDEEGNWVQNSEIPFSDAEEVCFSPNGSSLAIAGIDDVWIMGRDGKGNWVQNSSIPDGTFTRVYSICFSPDGGSLAISGWSDIRNSVLIMRSDGKGSWDQNFTIPCDDPCSARFSPDGRNLLVTHISEPGYSRMFGLDRANSRVCKSEPLLHNEAVVCFSPDGSSLAVGRGATTFVMELGKGGSWVKKARLRINKIRVKHWEVEAACFSPDGRSLATILVWRGLSPRACMSHVKIHEIKACARVLTARDKNFLQGTENFGPSPYGVAVIT